MRNVAKIPYLVSMGFRRFVILTLLVVSILLIPSVVFPNEMQWEVGDYLVAAALLSALVFGVDWVARSPLSGTRKTFFIIVIISIIVVIWGELAVGIFNP